MLNIKKEKYELIIIRVISAFLCHIVVFIQFNLINFTFDAQYLWSVQFHVGLIILLILSIILVLVKNIAIIVMIILFRFIMQVIICFPLGNAIEIKIALLASIIIDTNLILLFPANIILSSIIISLTLVLQRSITVFEQEMPGPSLYDMITILLGLIFFLVFTGILKIYNQRLTILKKHAGRRDEAISKLIGKNISFHRHVTTIAEESVISERKRISREIHDIIGYTLTNILMLIKVATVLSPKDSLDLIEKLRLAKQLSIDGLRDIRRTLHELRIVDGKEARGFNTVHRLVKSFEESTGTKIRIEYRNVSNMFFEQNKYFIYHMIQEGMLNAFKHGKATTIGILFWKDNSETEIIIVDNGTGCDYLKKGIGLIGMEERLKQFGGSIVARNTLNGFELIARIPNG